MPAPSFSAVYLPLLLSAAALLIAAASFLFLKSYLKRRTAPRFLQDEVLSEIREEVSSLLSAIDETTERDISLIEEREKKLKSALEEIDRRLGVYIRELEKRRDADTAYAALNSAQGMEGYLELGKNRYRVNETRVSEYTEAVPAFSGASKSEPKTPAEAAFPLPGFKVESSRSAASTGERIRELVKAGVSPQLIASRLGVSIAEAELAAALEERRTTTGI